MPGMSLFIDIKGISAKQKHQLEKTMDQLIFNEEYAKNTLLSDKTSFLGCTKYEQYPITTFDHGDYTIFLEGYLYGKQEMVVKKELGDLADLAFQKSGRAKRKIAKWLLETDGDFIVIFKDKRTGEIAVLNDLLGRLSLYYHKTKDRLILSREYRFVVGNIEDVQLDRMAIAQYLLLGYPLGKRTLVEGLHKFKPATLVRAGGKGSTISVEVLYTFNLEKKEHVRKPVEKNASQLLTLFKKACKDRVALYDKDILSLSGGYDSRCIAVCLNKVNREGLSNVTYSFWYSGMDIKYAKELVDIYKLDWNVYKLKPGHGRDLYELFRMKCGVNWLGMGFILPFFKRIKKEYGSNVTYFTGDGGDKTLRDVGPTKPLKSEKQLVNYILSTRNIFLMRDVTALTGLSKMEIVDDLRRHLMSFPEKDWDQKFIHFFLFDKVYNWHGEGEDRNRYFFWSVAPFYSIPFFVYAMNCPENQKEHFTLYRHFLTELSPEAAAIAHSDGLTLTESKKGHMTAYLTGILYQHPTLRKKVKKRLGNWESYPTGSNIYKCIEDQMNGCRTIDKYLKNSEIKKLIKDSGKYTKEDFDNLLTITTAIENFTMNKSSLEKYSDTEFA